jgi:O-antigen ligase
MLTAARTLLIVTLMLAPLPFGAVQPWAWGALAGAVVCVVMLWAAACVRSGEVTLRWSLAYIPALALLAMAAIQALFHLTLDPVGTREAFLKLVIFATIFFLVQHLYSDASQRVWRMVAAAVAIYAFVVAVFAIIQLFATPGLLYFTIKPRWGGYVFGPYVYHNAYAGLMEILIPISVGYAIGMASPPAPGSRGGSRVEVSKLAMLGFMALTCIVSVFLSASRGGVIVMAVEFALFAAVSFYVVSRSRDDAENGPMISRARKRRSLVLVISFCLLAVVTLSFYWLDTGFIWSRWQLLADKPEMAIGSRQIVTADTLRMSSKNLAHGVGLGAFEVAYPKYQTLAIDEVMDFAHNDCAQLLAETGILGWILLPVCMAGFLWHFWRLLRREAGSRAMMYWLQLGASIGVCGLVVHSFYDFNLHIPANAAWFVATTAVALLPADSTELRISLVRGRADRAAQIVTSTGETIPINDGYSR